MPRRGQTTPLADRFWAKVEKRGLDECWPWIGSLDTGGYGMIWDGVRLIRSHRASLLLIGIDPGILDVLHSCNNPHCVNPRHLRPGTELENSGEAAMLGRYNAKLSKPDVEKIRHLSLVGVPQRKIAEEFGVAQATISCCVNRKNWRHVK